MCWTDTSGVVEGCNQAPADVVGRSLDDVKGRAWVELCDDPEAARRLATWADPVTGDGEPVLNAELELPARDDAGRCW